MPENSESEWAWLKCQWLFVVLSWFARLPWACVQRLRRMSSSAPILPITAPRSPKKRCATWGNWWWGRMCKCTCTSPRCRRFRRWRKNWWKLPRRIWRRMRNCRWPKWEPDQKSLWVRVIKASRLDGFKMAVKEKMHFAARIMYVVSYKLFTGIAIYLIIVSSVKILKTPIIYKDVGNVLIENTPFAGINVCPSHLYPAELLIQTDKLFQKATYQGTAVDSFGEKWSSAQSAKLYYYIYRRCQTTLSHSRYFNNSYTKESLKIEPLLKDHGNIILQDHPEDQDFQKILRFVKKYQGNVDCSKMLAACRWGPDNTRNCSDIFELEQTETGQCCRFKPKDRQRKHTMKEKGLKWNIDEHSFFETKTSHELEGSPWYQKLAGSDHGLSFVIIMETEDMACPTNEGNAYMVYVHSSMDAPHPMTNGILIAPDHEVHINLNADITLSDKDVMNLPVHNRQCYFQIENDFLSSTYTENNCRTECRALLFLERCQCHKPGTTAGKGETICGPQHAICEKQVEEQLQKKGYGQMCLALTKPMACYHGCNEVEYHTSVSSTPYFQTPPLVKAMYLTGKQKTAVVKISFGSDTASARERQQQYDFWEIVGIIGGILGLMIGVDFMTAIHLIYCWGIYFKGLWLKRKLANSVVVRSIVNVTSILNAVHSVSTQTPTDCRPHPLEGKRKKFKRVVIRRKGAVAFCDPPIPLEPVAPAADSAISLEDITPDLIEELTTTNGTEIPAGSSRPTTMADIVITNELLKNMFVIRKRCADPVDLPDSLGPVSLSDVIDPVHFSDHIDSVPCSETIALVDRVTAEDVVAVINALASSD